VRVRVDALGWGQGCVHGGGRGSTVQQDDSKMGNASNAQGG